MLRRKILVLVLVTVLTVAGFVVGQAVSASGNPGTQSDPLVTKSYIDGEVSKLQAKIDSLKVEVDNLKSEITKLEQK